MKRRQQGILTGMPFMANIASRTFVDDLGRKLYLAHAPHRIVSLAPGVTEMLFALQAGDRVIAVSRFCDYPPAARQKPNLGSLSADVESLVALKADLILVPRPFFDSGLIEKLEASKINIYVMEAVTVEGVLSHLHMLGRMAECSSIATQVVSDIRRRVESVKERTASLPRLRLLYVLKTDPLTTVGPGSLGHQLIELAGAQNIGATKEEAHPVLSIEEVLEWNPDVLVFSGGGPESMPVLEPGQARRWQRMAAVRTERLYSMDSALIDRPGPRIAEGLERLAGLVHPGTFPGMLSFAPRVSGSSSSP